MELEPRQELREELIREIRAELLNELQSRGLDEGVLQELRIEHGVVPESFYRMTFNQRVQHLVLMISFLVLALTGLALKVPAETAAVFGPAGDMLFSLRGVLHRIAAAWMLGGSFYHLYYVFFTGDGRVDVRALWFSPRKDLQDLLQTLRLGLGLSEAPPEMGRVTYKEKLEYWALVWGTIVMSVTGVILWSASFWSGIVLDVSRAVHWYEAILAILAILIWHMYNVHLKPGAFPMNRAWIDGRISREEMMEEHYLEYKRLLKEKEERDVS